MKANEMDLIEKLGGYEKAKAIVTQNIKDFEEAVDEVGIYHPSSGWIVHEDLVKELLQYRREHNIYEEGDKVVMISKRRAPKLWTWIHTTNWRPNHSLLDCGENLLYPFSNDEFRHATDAEIDANRRLDL